MNNELRDKAIAHLRDARRHFDQQPEAEPASSGKYEGKEMLQLAEVIDEVYGYGYPAHTIAKHVMQRGYRLHPPMPAAQPQVPEGYALTPIDPTDGLLISMACRDRHDFGLLPRGMQESIMGGMRQVHEEVVGAGFYNPDKESEYKSMLSAEKEEL